MSRRTREQQQLPRPINPFGVLGALLLVSLMGGCGGPANNAPSQRMDEVSQLRKDMAVRLVKRNRFDQAVPYLTELLAKYPKDSRLHLLLGIVLREKETYAAAEQELLRSIELDPQNPEAFAALGVLKNKQRRHQEAEALHRKAIELAPKDARFHNNLGFCLFLMERYEEAEAAVLEAIHLDPGLRCAFNNLGFVFGMQDRPEEALRAFSKAGSQAMALTNMGTVQELLGKPTAARRYYEKALRTKSGYQPALQNLQALDPQTYPSLERQQAGATPGPPSSAASPGAEEGATAPAGHDEHETAEAKEDAAAEALDNQSVVAPAQSRERAPATKKAAPPAKEER